MSGSDIAVRVARIDTVAERINKSDWYARRRAVADILRRLAVVVGMRQGNERSKTHIP